MEMESKSIYPTTVFFFIGMSLVFCYEDSSKMKQMLEKLVEQNKKLEEKFATITDGLADMCRAVNLATCDCRNIDKTDSGKVMIESNDSENSSAIEDASKVLMSSSDDILISLESEGEVDDSVKLTIKFEASEGYGVEWLQMFRRGNGIVRTPGNMVTTKLLNDRYLYTSNFKVTDFKITRLLFIRIHSQLNIAHFNLNCRAIRKQGKQKFGEIKYKITSYSPSIVLPDDIVDEYNITINVDRNILELEDKGNPFTSHRPEYYFTYINATIEGNEMEEMIGSDQIQLIQVDHGIGDVEVTITITEEYLENGGTLSFALRQIPDQFVESMYVGVVIKLLRSGRQSIVPQNVLSVYSLRENIYAASTTISILCFAMGNPVPNVTISKVRKYGTEELKSDVIIDDKYTVLKSVTLHDHKKNGKALTGTYKCKATNGIYIKTTDTFVQLYKDIEFDERKTGITLNTTGKVVVSCKASGNPRPRIEIRLGNVYGPDLLKANGNFTSMNTIRGGTIKAVLTFSPVDERYDVVYCVAVQESKQLYKTLERKILIFPDKSESDWSYDKYSYYESFRRN